MTPDELVLAFDADCRRCRAVAQDVRRRCPGLEVLPLRDYRVAAWRAQAFDDDPPWTPTLLAVTVGADGTDRVRAWTGARLATGLVGTLGPRRAARLLLVLARMLRTPSSRRRT